MREHNVQRWPFEHCAFNAAEGGHVSVLEWLKKHGITIHVKACWYRAVENGRVNVLDWLLDHRHSLYHFVMDLAAKAGQICVLEVGSAARGRVERQNLCSRSVWWSFGRFEVAPKKWMPLGWQCYLLGARERSLRCC